MPQASDEMRALMGSYFGDEISEQGPMEYLKANGYTLTRRWTWWKPGVKDYEAMSLKEYNCLAFLIQEWDFGGLEGEGKQEDSNAR